MSRKLHDTKNDFKSRNILAFCLFVVLGILSVACVTKAVLLNGSVVQNQFTDYNVASVFRQDLIDYTSDSFIKNGLDISNVSNVITQAKAEKIISTIKGAREPRSTGWIYICLPEGGTVRVATTHLALESSEITIQNIADVNKKFFGQDQLTPTLLIGDFNATEDSDPIKYAKIKWQEIGVGTGFTIPSNKPNRKLDYVMGFPKKWKSERYEIIARADLSDHCFVMADVIYEEN